MSLMSSFKDLKTCSHTCRNKRSRTSNWEGLKHFQSSRKMESMHLLKAVAMVIEVVTDKTKAMDKDSNTVDNNLMVNNPTEANNPMALAKAMVSKIDTIATPGLKAEVAVKVAKVAVPTTEQSS